MALYMIAPAAAAIALSTILEDPCHAFFCIPDEMSGEKDARS